MLLDIGTSLDSFFQLLSILFIFAVVLALTYFSTRWIAGYQKSHLHQTNLRVVETLKITQNKYIQIVEAGDTYLVLAVCKDSVTMLKELSKDQIKEFDEVQPKQTQKTTESFQEIFAKVREHIPKK